MTARRRLSVPWFVLAGRRRRLSLAAGVVVLAALVWRYFSAPPGPPEVLTEGPYDVQSVVDGDTLLLANHARVRLIGADTPETVKPNHPVEPWGLEASEFTRQFVAGQQVRLEFDRERLDKYGRFLAYVWVGDRMLNEELIRAGLARAELQYHYSSSMKTRFRHAEAEAKSAGRGIWSGQPAAADSL
jgi:micrococcal nuclease